MKRTLSQYSLRQSGTAWTLQYREDAPERAGFLCSKMVHNATDCISVIVGRLHVLVLEVKTSSMLSTCNAGCAENKVANPDTWDLHRPGLS